MKEKRLLLRFMIIFIIIFIIFFIGCNSDNYEPRSVYGLWVDYIYDQHISLHYNQFESLLNQLNIGEYIHLEITNEQKNQMSIPLGLGGHKDWTKDEIYEWLIFQGFNKSEANDLTKIITTSKYPKMNAIFRKCEYYIFMILR